MEVDHINGNPLDNRKENLRICTHKQNGKNYSIPNNNTSGYKGVRWHKRDKIWEAFITVECKQRYLGRFKDIKDAVKCYNQNAIILYGEFAKLNEVK
jgi:hypothetical protein